MSHTVAVCSAKGGSGKTVFAASLAKCLAHLGFPSLLVDCDAATNGMTLLYLDQTLKARSNLAPVVPRGVFEPSPRASSYIVQLDADLYFLPSTFTLTQTEACPPDAFGSTLQSVILSESDAISFIILDVQSGSDLYAQHALAAANDVILVSEYDPISAEGAERLKRLFASVMPADRTWTLYNKVLPEFTTSLGDFLSVAKYLTPLPWDADVIRAFVRRELALDMIAGNRYTTSVVTIADTLFHSEIGQAVSEWRDNQLKVVREPLEQQLIDLGVREERLDRLAASVRRTRSLDPAWWIGGTLILTLAALLGYIVSTRSHSVWVTIALAVAFCVQIIFAAYALLRSRHLAKQRWQLTSLQKELDDIRGERTRIEEVLPQLRDMRSP